MMGERGDVVRRRVWRLGHVGWLLPVAVILVAAGVPGDVSVDPFDRQPGLRLDMRAWYVSSAGMRRIAGAAPLAAIAEPKGRVGLSATALLGEGEPWTVLTVAFSVRTAVPIVSTGQTGIGSETRLETTLTAPATGGSAPVEVTAALPLRYTGPGTYHGAEVVRGVSQRLWVCVPVPATETKGGVLRGYTIGEYPKGVTYPERFVEVPEEACDAHVSPHLRLERLLSPDPPGTPSGWPRYAPVSFALVDKVETIDRELRDRGWVHETVTFTSGFRTPAYNKGVGGASQSYHMEGLALDFVVDKNDDGVMDDVNGDGVVNIQDAIAVGHLIRQLETGGTVTPGGTGAYETIPAKPGEPVNVNLHTDVRGKQAKWGRHYANPDTEEYTEVPWD
jgi:hypothetical protein